MFARLLYALGLLSLWKRIALRRRAVVLMYHRVLPESALAGTCSHPGIVVRRDSFERHLRMLSRRFRMLSLQEFEEHLRTRTPFPSGACLVTFDDGWLDTYTEAWPLLRRYRVPAAVFLPSAFIGSERVFWQEQLAYLLARSRKRALSDDQFAAQAEPILRSAECEALPQLSEGLAFEKIQQVVQSLKRCDVAESRRLIGCLAALLGDDPQHAPQDVFMSWDMVREMADDGVTFGAHGVTHSLLTLLPVDDLSIEVRESRDAVQRELGGVSAFSYPNGDWNASVAGNVKAAGFDVAFSTAPGFVSASDEAFSVRRINIHQEASSTDAMFMARVLGVL